MSRSVVVTGAGQGIGRATVQRLIDDGWYAVGLERDTRHAATLARTIGDQGTSVHGDVTDPDALARAAAEAVRIAPLRGWVNNAGIMLAGSLDSGSLSDIRTVLGVNLEGALLGCRAAVCAMIEQGTPGAIVNISSIHGRRSFAGATAYDVSKGGVDALTRNVAVEYGPRGIRANAVAPGAIRTPLLQAGIDRAQDPAAVSRTLEQSPPLLRIGEAHEVAAVVSFLLSDDAAYITGQSLAVDGGWSVTGATP